MNVENKPTLEKVGLLRRAVGMVLDGLTILIGTVFILMPVQLAFGTPAKGGFADNLMGAVMLVGSISYFVFSWSRLGGQTLGGRVLKFKVVNVDGSKLSIRTSVIRVLAIWLSSVPLYLGLIWVAFDKDKQGWHDKICQTYVIEA